MWVKLFGRFRDKFFSQIVSQSRKTSLKVEMFALNHYLVLVKVTGNHFLLLREREMEYANWRNPDNAFRKIYFNVVSEEDQHRFTFDVIANFMKIVFLN
jgi:hypothetical protein